MAVIATLNTLVQADTSSFDRGIERAEKTAGGFGQSMEKQSGVVSRAFTTIGLGGLPGLAQLGGVVSSIDSKIAMAWKTATLFVGVMAGMGRTGVQAAALLVGAFTSPIATLERIGGIIERTFGAGAAVPLRFFATIARAAFGDTEAAARGVAGRIGALFHSVGSTLLAPFRAVAGFIGGIAAAAFAPFQAAARQMAARISGIFHGIAAGIGSTFSRLGSLLRDAATGIGSGVRHLAGIAGKTLAGAIGPALAGAIGGAFSSAIGTVAGLVGTGVAAVVGALGAPLLVLGGAAGLLAGGFLAAAAAGTGLAIALSHVASEGAASIATLSTLSREVGINVHALSGLANTAGLNPEGFTHSLLHMQRSIEEGSTQAAGALNKMGLSLAELRDASPIQQLEAIYGAFGQLETQGERASAAMALFGRSGIQMMDSLDRGMAGLDAARARAERFGLTFTQQEATLVRQSLRAWGQWSLAMEGVSRKLAVIFAPAWQELGNIGGDIGERLVALVSDREVVQAVHGLWSGISDAGHSAWNAISEAVQTFWTDTLGLSTVSGDELKDVFIKATVAAEYVFRNIGPLARQGWNEMKAAGLEAADAVVGFVNRQIAAVENLLNRAAQGLNRQIRTFNDSWGSTLFGRVEEFGTVSLGRIGTDDLADMIREARQAVAEGRNQIAESFAEFMERRLEEIQEAAEIMGDAADRAERAAGSAQGGARVAPGGNAAAIAGSQEAFSILNSRQADLASVMREQLAVQQRNEQLMRDMLAELRRRPNIGVARP